MSTVSAPTADDERVWHDAEEHGHAPGGSTMLGFWLYLMSDCLIFAMLFATWGVVGASYVGGPRPGELFELPLVAVNTAMLLLSSLTCGMAMIAVQEERARAAIAWLLATGAFGAAFLGIELYEFSVLIAEGATPQRSAFLSSFFTLVGTHGLHVASGLVWLSVLVAQLARRGLIEANVRRLNCFSLFWHFLDVVWIGVFTFVYLLGSLR